MQEFIANGQRSLIFQLMQLGRQLMVMLVLSLILLAILVYKEMMESL